LEYRVFTALTDWIIDENKTYWPKAKSMLNHYLKNKVSADNTKFLIVNYEKVLFETNCYDDIENLELEHGEVSELSQDDDDDDSGKRKRYESSKYPGSMYKKPCTNASSTSSSATESENIEEDEELDSDHETESVQRLLKHKSVHNKPTPQSKDQTRNRPVRNKDPRGEEPRPRENGPRENGPRENGPRENGPQENGPRENGPRENGPRENGPRENGPRENGPRENGPRENGPQENRPRENGPRGSSTTPVTPRSSQVRGELLSLLFCPVSPLSHHRMRKPKA
jgi:hypothetical protein